MSVVAELNRILSEAGLQLLTTLAERLRLLGEEYDDPIYLILESAARVAADRALLARGLETTLSTAAHSSQQGVLEELHALLTYGGAASSTFAQGLWLAFVFGIPSASETLWDNYTELRRSLLIETGRSTHESWLGWVFPLSEFFGALRAQYELAMPDLRDLFNADEVIEALEVIPARPASGATRAPASGPSSPIQVEPIAAAAAISNYLNAVLEHSAWAHIQGHPAARNGRVPLADIYIPLRVIPLREALPREDMVRFETPGFQRFLASDAAWQNSSGEAGEGAGVPLSDALDRHPGLLVMGPLGAGKTTLLNHLAAEHARVLLEEGGRGIEIENPGGGVLRLRLARPLPIYLRLSDYLEQRHDDEDLTHFMARHLVALTGGDPGVATLLRHLLDSGQCLVLLDGLDEAVSDEQGRLLVREVQAAGSSWQQAHNRVIVACRSSSNDLPSLMDFEPLLISPLDRAQVNTLALRWKLVFERLNAPLRRDEELTRQAHSDTLLLLREIATSSRLLELARRPLMLRLIAQVYHPGVALPARLAALLRVVAESLIREWRLPERVSGPYQISGGDLEQVLAELAFWLQSSRASGSLDERELRLICLRIWRELAPDLPLAHLEEIVHSLISAVRTQQGPLVEVAPGRYAFAAPGLREYFAALHLVSSTRMAPARVRPLLHHPRWSDTIRLAVGIASLRSRDDASDLVRSAILHPDPGVAGHDEGTDFEPLLHRDLLFAAQVMGDEIDVRADLARDVAERLMALWLNAERINPGRFTWLADQAYQRMARLDGTAAGRYAAQIALDALLRGDERQQAYAADALTLWPTLTGDVYAALLSAGRSASPLVRQSVARALRRFGVQNREAYSLLLGLASDPDERVSGAAQRTLEGAPPVPYEALQLWVDYLHSEDPLRQRLSLNMLQQIGALPPLVIGELLRLIEDPSSAVRQRAIEVLGGVNHLPDDAMTALSRLISDPDPQVRVAAINALRRPVRLPPGVLEPLIRWTQDPHAAVRRAAAQALGTCSNDDDAVIEALIELLAAPGDSIRESVIEPLLRKGQNRPEVIRILAASLRGNLLGIRMAIASAVGQVRRPGPELQQLLLTLLRDSDFQVRQQMLRSVAQMQAPGQLIVDELVQMCGIHDPRLAGEATRALANQRGLSDTALTALVSALPLHWERAGSNILACLRAHLPLNGHVSTAIMDLAVSPEGARRASTQVPTGLRVVAVEILGLTLSDTPAALQIMLDAASEAETPEVRAAALRGLARAEALTPALSRTLQQALHRQPLTVRLAAASALGELVQRLPDPNLSFAQLVSIAAAVKQLINDLPARAAWEPDAAGQDDALLALARLASRARRASLRLGSSSEQA